MTEITNKNFQILKLGNPILRLTAKELTREEILSSEIQELIPKMWSVMKEAGGIGLAAPQIGISIQLAVIKLENDSERYDNLEDSEEFIIFNPKLEVLDEKKTRILGRLFKRTRIKRLCRKTTKAKNKIFR